MVKKLNPFNTVPTPTKMGNLCQKRKRAQPALTFSDALRKTQQAPVLKTDALTTMVMSFRHAYDNNYDTAPQFAQASLVIGGLVDVSESLSESERVVAALVLASRMQIPPSYTPC